MVLSFSVTLKCKNCKSKLTERRSTPADSRFGTTAAKSCKVKDTSFKIFSNKFPQAFLIEVIANKQKVQKKKLNIPSEAI